MMRLLSLIILFFAAPLSMAMAKEPKPLFASEDTLTLRIEAPFTSLIRAAPRSEDPFPATLTLEGAAPETHTITLAPRGLSRRNTEICGFPPLRVAFEEKPKKPSLFKGQKKLKLVTHCRKSHSFQKHVLLEYNAYRLYNAFTPSSLRVRLADIEYFDTDRDRTLVTRKGFFIEDIDDAAKRNGVKEINIDDITASQLDPQAAARYALFQYMIGNYDWSMHSGPAGDDCCHNSKLIGDREPPLEALTPVPYDFDHSGLVDTPYAAVPSTVPIRNVRARYFRGFCAHNEHTISAASAIRQSQEAFDTLIDETPGLASSARHQSKRFLKGFFKNIADRESIEKRLLRTCRE